MLIWAGSQTIQMIREHSNLNQVYANQEPSLQAAQKIRKQMDVIASGTAKLAGQGNANAKIIVQALAARGITIDTNAHTPTPPQ
jgi:hypothetical protein